MELKTTFLIDDHTSIVKVHYCNADYDFRGQEAQLFGPIASGLKQILLNYLNEIKLPNVPLQVNHFDCGSSDEHQVKTTKYTILEKRRSNVLGQELEKR